MFVRKSEFDKTIMELVEHQEADCREIGDLAENMEALVVASVDLNVTIDHLWKAITNLEAVAYGDTPKPVKAAKKVPPVATSTRTKKV